MTWAEFQLRLFSYNRQKEEELFKFRYENWITYIAPKQDPKKMKKTIDQFMPIGKPSRATEEQREIGRKAMEEYIKIKMEQNGGVKC